MNFLKLMNGYIVSDKTETELAPAERTGNNLKGFKDFHLENRSSQGQNLAVTVLCVQYSLDSGHMHRCFSAGPGIAQLNLLNLEIFSPGTGGRPVQSEGDREPESGLFLRFVPENHVPCPDIRAIWFPVAFPVVQESLSLLHSIGCCRVRYRTAIRNVRFGLTPGMGWSTLTSPPSPLPASAKYRCRANVAHVRQSGSDSGMAFRIKCLNPFQSFPLHSKWLPHQVTSSLGGSLGPSPSPPPCLCFTSAAEPIACMRKNSHSLFLSVSLPVPLNLSVHPSQALPPSLSVSSVIPLKLSLFPSHLRRKRSHSCVGHLPLFLSHCLCIHPSQVLSPSLSSCLFPFPLLWKRLHSCVRPHSPSPSLSLPPILTLSLPPSPSFLPSLSLALPPCLPLSLPLPRTHLGGGSDRFRA